MTTIGRSVDLLCCTIEYHIQVTAELRGGMSVPALFNRALGFRSPVTLDLARIIIIIIAIINIIH